MDNLGGLHSILLIPESNLTQVPDVIDGTCFGDVVFADASENFFLQAYENAELKENQKRERGNEFAYSLVCRIPRGSSGNLLDISRFDGSRCLVMASDNNSETRVLGAFGVYCKVVAVHTTGRRSADLNYYELTVSLADRFRAPYSNQVIMANVSIASQGVISFVDGVADVTVGNSYARIVKLTLWWSEGGTWRMGDVTVLRDSGSVDVSFEEQVKQGVTKSGLVLSAIEDEVKNIVLNLASSDVVSVQYKTTLNA